MPEPNAEHAPSRRARRWRRAGRVAALAILAWVGVVVAYVLLIGAHDGAQRADAIVVLGAAAYDAHPSPVFAERIDHGITLYRAHLAPVVVFTGGFGDGARFSEGAVARRYARRHGVPASAILVETRSRTTRDNLAGAAQLLRERGLRRVLLVSDPMHMARALYLARQAGLEAYGSPTPTSRFESLGARLRFLFREVLELHAERARDLWATSGRTASGDGAVTRARRP